MDNNDDQDDDLAGIIRISLFSPADFIT